MYINRPFLRIAPMSFRFLLQLALLVLKVLEGFPAFSLVLLRLAINLRTVIVTAAIHQGLNSALRSEELTPPLDLLALGRLHTIYIV